MIGALSILALYLLAQTITLAADFGRSGVPATDTITVQGSGEVSIVPDVAKISFSVENVAATVAVAQAATTKQTDAALAAMKAAGIADKDIKTTSYSISPQYAYPTPCYGITCPVPVDGYTSGSPKITGYQVSQSVQVTVRELDGVGAVLESLGKLGVQNVYGPNFALDDSTAAYAAARADAIMKAKQQATVLAKQLGVRLGKVVNFSESSGGYPYPVMYDMGMGGASKVSAPNIPAGENTYNASVSITYEIR